MFETLEHLPYFLSCEYKGIILFVASSVAHYHYYVHRGVVWMKNSVDPDQLASEEAS